MPFYRKQINCEAASNAVAGTEAAGGGQRAGEQKAAVRSPNARGLLFRTKAGTIQCALESMSLAEFEALFVRKKFALHLLNRFRPSEPANATRLWVFIGGMKLKPVLDGVCEFMTA